MTEISLLGKRNSDLSYSVSVEAGDLEQYGFVNFYNETTGEGYQRNETQRASRGRDIEKYISRCSEAGTKPALFEMTANALIKGMTYKWVPLDETEPYIGWLEFSAPSIGRFMSMIDGGTRLLGITNAIGKGSLDPKTKFDVRLYVDASLATEVAYFLLINETQKKVRTDLSLRVVQRLFDEGDLTPKEIDILKTADKGADGWRYDAIRIAGDLNSDSDSKWNKRVQMPGESARQATLQAFFSSMQDLLTNKSISNILMTAEEKGALKTSDGQPTDVRQFLTRVVRNFWDAAALVNPDANAEPETSVLWAPIGANTHHIAFASILATLLAMNDYDFTVPRFKNMMTGSHTEEYEYWYTKPGTRKDFAYPPTKGEATKMTGAANYKRLADELETQWRAQLHKETGDGIISA